MSRTKILVVDDEEDITRAVAMRLRHAGYDVWTAGDGMEAMRVALNETPDLVILDIGLPDQNGHEIAQRLFAVKQTIATPIIFLTARTTDEDRGKAYQAGAIAYLTKPFQSNELLTAVSRAEATSHHMRCTECVPHGTPVPPERL